MTKIIVQHFVENLLKVLKVLKKRLRRSCQILKSCCATLENLTAE